MSSRRSSWWLFGAAVSGAVALGAGGSQAAGGKLDPSFGTGGRVVTDLGSASDEVTAVAIQPDGKIVAAGGSATAGFALVRYTTDGRLDAAFGRGGKVLTAFGIQASSVAIQTDGKIVAAGDSNAAGGRDFAVVRYTRGGNLDASFGRGGKVLTDLGLVNDSASALAIQKDGKIIAAGRSGQDFAVVRYTTGGKLDTSFGAGGMVLASLDADSFGEAEAVAIQEDGKIVAAGRSATLDGKYNDNYNFALVRYTTSGRLDVGFGRGGKVVTDLGTNDDQAPAVAVQADGKIVVAGVSGDHVAADFALVRYTPGGRLDPTFGAGGKVRTDFGTHDWDFLDAVVAQPDGKVVAVGSSAVGYSHDFALARYTPDGKLDASFGCGGKVLTAFASDLPSLRRSRSRRTGRSSPPAILSATARTKVTSRSPATCPDGSVTPDHRPPVGPSGDIPEL